MTHGFDTLIGGRLCLDFVNSVRRRTVPRRSRGRGGTPDLVVTEQITSYDALVEWAAHTHTVSQHDGRVLRAEAGQKPLEATAVLQRALELRGALYALFTASVEAWPAPAAELAVLNREVLTARAHEVLIAASAPPGFHWAWNVNVAALDCLLWPVVRSGTDLLVSADLRRVGQCPGDQCGRLFLDTSRAGRRQWCDMALCGNAAKVRRFRARQRTAVR